MYCKKYRHPLLAASSDGGFEQIEEPSFQLGMGRRGNVGPLPGKIVPPSPCTDKVANVFPCSYVVATDSRNTTNTFAYHEITLRTKLNIDRTIYRFYKINEFTIRTFITHNT